MLKTILIMVLLGIISFTVFADNRSEENRIGDDIGEYFIPKLNSMKLTALDKEQYLFYIEVNTSTSLDDHYTLKYRTPWSEKTHFTPVKTMRKSFKFCTVEYLGKLYLIYNNPDDGNNIYYHTYSRNNKGDLVWSEGYPLNFNGIPRIAKKFNDKLNLIYTDSNGTWQCADFDINSNAWQYKDFFDESGNKLGKDITPKGAAVFVAGDNKQRMMIGYCNTEKGTVGTVLFNGENLYSNYIFHNCKAKNILLETGSIKGCKSNNKESVQLWMVGFNKQNNDKYKIWHTQYTPGGENGDYGFFLTDNSGGEWHEYQNSQNMTAYPEMFSVIAKYEPKDNNEDILQKKIILFHFYAKSTFTFKFRRIYFLSNILKKINTEYIPATNNDYRDSWILEGVIMGVPPYFGNGNIDDDIRKKYSKVTISKDWIDECTQTNQYKNTFTASYSGNPFTDMSGTVKAEYKNIFEDILKTTSTETYLEDQTLTNDKDIGGVNNADIGWLLFSAPDIKNKTYQLFDYNDKDLKQVFNIISIPKVNMIYRQFTLSNPEDPSNFPVTMESAAASNDYKWWNTSAPEPDYNGTDDYKHYVTLGLLNVAAGTMNPISKYIDSFTEDNSTSMTNSISTGISLYGFSSGNEGEFKISKNRGSTIELGWKYEAYLPTPDDLPGDGEKYIKLIDIQPYILKAKTENCWWIPKEYKNSRPWCLTYKITDYKEFSDEELKSLKGTNAVHL
jgi:hypothetical protein